MRIITRTERLEVAQYYLLGYTYRDMEEEIWYPMTVTRRR